MHKLLAILFLFPLLCFGQSKTPINRGILQTPLDANGLSITNEANGPSQDLLAVVSDSRWAIDGIPGNNGFVQKLRVNPSFMGKYSLSDLAVSSTSYGSFLSTIGIFAQIATNRYPASINKTVLIMLNAGAADDSERTNALKVWDYWHTNGWKTLVGTDPGIYTVNLTNFNIWIRTTARPAYDYLWDLATNTPLTFADGVHNDEPFNAILATNFVANILPNIGLRPMAVGGQNVYGEVTIFGNRNAIAEYGRLAMTAHGGIRIDHSYLGFLGLGAFSNTPMATIDTTSAGSGGSLQFNTFNNAGSGQRLILNEYGYVSFNTNENPAALPPFAVAKPFDPFGSQYIAGFYPQAGDVAKMMITTNGAIHLFKGANVTSAATITPTGPIFHVTAGNTISTINLPAIGFTGSIYVIPDNLWSTTTSGNIALATTAVVGKCVIFTYDGTKWYPSY